MQYNEIRIKIVGRDLDGFVNAIEIRFFNNNRSQTDSQIGFSRSALRNSLFHTIQSWEKSSSHVLDCNCKYMSGRYPPDTLIPAHNDPDIQIAVGGQQKCELNQRR